MRRHVLVVVFLVSGLVAAAAPAVADTVGGEKRLAGGKSHEVQPAMVWNQKAAEYFMVYATDRFKPGYAVNQIYGKRIGADGNQVGGGRIGGVAWKNSIHPAVAWNEIDNQYLVVWQDNRNWDTRRWDVYGRIMDAAGKPLTKQFRIGRAKGNADEINPAVAWSYTANQYLVVWEDSRNSLKGRGWDIYGQYVAPNGDRIGTNFRISGKNATKHEQKPAVSWNPAATRHVVVWQDTRHAFYSGDATIYGRLVTGMAGTVGGEFRIGDARKEVNPDVACRPTGGQCLVVWEDRRNFATRQIDIYGRRVNGDGKALGSATRLCGPGAVTHDVEPAVAWSQASSRYLVVWQDYRESGAGGGVTIYGQKVTALGNRHGKDFRIPKMRDTVQSQPAVAWNPWADRYLVAWTDQRSYWSGPLLDIWGRRVAG